MKDKASRMVNHIESTIEIQRNAVFPVHFAGGSISYLGDSSCLLQDKRRHDKQLSF